MEHWKRISGILCDRRISLRVKGKVYKTVVRPAMMYGAETWVVKEAHVGVGLSPQNHPLKSAKNRGNTIVFYLCIKGQG